MMADPENSFIMDRETYQAMAGMLEKAERERDDAIRRLALWDQQAKARQGGELTAVGKLEKKHRQLCADNEELRDLCCYLDDERQNSKQLASEWQKLGSYTASVLKSESETYECKIQTLEKFLERLTNENKELREMCLYLDQPQAHQGGLHAAASGAGVASASASVRSISAARLVSRKSDVHVMARFDGLSGESTLKDSRKKRQVDLEQFGKLSDQECIGALEKRVERLDAEKLELVKSLSAAHFLAANTSLEPSGNSTTTTKQAASGGTTLTAAAAAGDDARHLQHSLALLHAHAHVPPDLKEQLLRTTRLAGGGKSSNSESSKRAEQVSHHLRKRGGHMHSPDAITKAATLLDVYQRLEAAERSGFADALEEAEVHTLQLLVKIAWNAVRKQLKIGFVSPSDEVVS